VWGGGNAALNYGVENTLTPFEIKGAFDGDVVLVGSGVFASYAATGVCHEPHVNRTWTTCVTQCTVCMAMARRGKNVQLGMGLLWSAGPRWDGGRAFTATDQGIAPQGEWMLGERGGRVLCGIGVVTTQWCVCVYICVCGVFMCVFMFVFMCVAFRWLWRLLAGLATLSLSPAKDKCTRGEAQRCGRWHALRSLCGVVAAAAAVVGAVVVAVAVAVVVIAAVVVVVVVVAVAAVVVVVAAVVVAVVVVVVVDAGCVLGVVCGRIGRGRMACRRCNQTRTCPRQSRCVRPMWY